MVLPHAYPQFKLLYMLLAAGRYHSPNVIRQPSLELTEEASYTLLIQGFSW